MRILQIGKYWFPQRGGMETLLQQYAEGLAARGHAVRVLVSAASSEDSFEQARGVQLWRCARYGEVASVPLCPSLPGALRRSLVQFDPEVVHLHLPNPLAAAAWLAFGDDRPLVVTYHSDIVRQQALLRLWTPWRDRLLARASLIHATSDALIESSPVLSHFSERCRAIPPGIDPAAWNSPDSEDVQRFAERIGEDAFLFVGRLVYYKGVDILMEAVRDSDLRLAVCGDGPLRGLVERAAAESSGRVVCLGDVQAARMPALFAASKGLVLPSVAPSETFGVVQLEAMAAGIPLVVSRASAGVVSVHRGADSALFVQPGDVAGLREALLRVRDEAGLVSSMVAAGKQLLRESYAPQQQLDQLEALLTEVVGRSTAA